MAIRRPLRILRRVHISDDAAWEYDTDRSVSTEGKKSVPIPAQIMRKLQSETGGYEDGSSAVHGTQLSASVKQVKQTARDRPLPMPSPREETLSQGHSGHGTGTYFNYEFTCGTLDVKVYTESITDIRGMDAIVNAANEHLAHGGGVAYIISKAAGIAMDTECRQFVSRHGRLSVTENFVSGPGRMNCKGIIHAVGPQWYDYVDAQEDCARDLYKTIMNILEEAGKRRYMKIAMPAISAGIFGVPNPLCAEMYVKAFIDFARRSPESIAVHLIDINPEILGLVKAAYQESFRNPNSLDFQNAMKYPSTRMPVHSTAGQSGTSDDEWEFCGIDSAIIYTLYTKELLDIAAKYGAAVQQVSDKLLKIRCTGGKNLTEIEKCIDKLRAEVANLAKYEIPFTPTQRQTVWRFAKEHGKSTSLVVHIDTGHGLVVIAGDDYSIVQATAHKLKVKLGEVHVLSNRQNRTLATDTDSSDSLVIYPDISGFNLDDKSDSRHGHSGDRKHDGKKPPPQCARDRKHDGKKPSPRNRWSIQPLDQGHSDVKMENQEPEPVNLKTEAEPFKKKGHLVIFQD